MHQAEQVGLHYFVKPVPDLELSLDHLEIFLFFFFFSVISNVDTSKEHRET